MMTTPRPNRLQDSALTALADRLALAARTGVACDPVRDVIDLSDLDVAYAVQDIGTTRAIAAGRRIIGRKIGLTSLAVQKQLGVDQPDYGMLFADMVMGEGTPIPPDRLMQPKIEAEVALILGRDLDMANPTIADVIWATAYVLPALEIVGSRIRNWDIRIVDTIADNASSGLLVLGGPARALDGVDLRGAGEMVRRGRPLRAGEVVLTGALGPMVPVVAGDVFTAQIDGLGTVSAVFA
jgi:2-keto-4-pentenoate hydratase